MEKISIFTTTGFALVTLLALWLFFNATKNKTTILYLAIWTGIVGILGLSGFYQDATAFPPRFPLLLGPGLLVILLVFLSKNGKAFMDGLDLKWLTLLHVIRIPVEIVLYQVFLAGLIPGMMTFHGNNFDIISGITAPVLYYLVFVKKQVGQRGLLLWNIFCLGLLLNVVIIAILSAQTPFQALAFDQPNIGITYFPFVWLPAVVVPIVLFSHLAGIRILVRSLRKAKTEENIALDRAF